MKYIWTNIFLLLSEIIENASCAMSKKSGDVGVFAVLWASKL